MTETGRAFRTTKIVQTRDYSGVDQTDSHGAYKKLLDSRHILKIKLAIFIYGLNVGQGKKGVKDDSDLEELEGCSCY